MIKDIWNDGVLEGGVGAHSIIPGFSDIVNFVVPQLCSCDEFQCAICSSKDETDNRPLSFAGLVVRGQQP